MSDRELLLDSSSSTIIITPTPVTPRYIYAVERGGPEESEVIALYEHADDSQAIAQAIEQAKLTAIAVLLDRWPATWVAVRQYNANLPTQHRIVDYIWQMRIERRDR